MEVVLNIIEFAETIYGNKLTVVQKEILTMIEQAHNENKQLFIFLPQRAGKNMIKNVVDKWRIHHEEDN